MESTEKSDRIAEYLEQISYFDAHPERQETLKEIFKSLKDDIYEISAEHRADTQLFCAHQEQLWGKCFAVSEAMYELVLEATEKYVAFVSENIPSEEFERHKYTFVALRNIHGRVCQIFLEVLCLMQNGFADGAYARWRTMYELCCYAEFIKVNGEETAKAYIEQADTEDQHPTWAKVAPCFANKGAQFKPRISDIRAECMLNSVWENQYKLGCTMNHPSPQGTLGRLSVSAESNVIPVGRSDFGMTAPAEHSAIALMLCTRIFFWVFPNADAMIQCEVLDEWIDLIRESYFSTSDTVFGERRSENNLENDNAKEENICPSK